MASKMTIGELRAAERALIADMKSSFAARRDAATDKPAPGQERQPASTQHPTHPGTMP